MNTKNQVLTIIPARGGSKGIPRKNILPLAGHPLLAYSIAAGRQATSVDRVIVSTDDEEIAQVARQYGAETPFLRPSEFAQDKTLDFPVFMHALKWLAENENYHPEIIIQLRPTSPVRPKELINQAVRILLENPQADSVRGVVPSGQNPHKMWHIQEDGQMKSLLQVPGIEEPYNAPRQNLPSVYWQSGHIDAIRSSTILEKNSMSGDLILPIQLDSKFTIDIDNPRDWQQAEQLMLQSDLDYVRPLQAPESGLPDQINLIVLDFDGVLTDNRVWVDQNGVERVAAHRGDGMGISLLKKAGYQVVVLSTETNQVVSARCNKMNIQAFQGIEDKGTAIKILMEQKRVDPKTVVYVGNDVNDLPCFPLVGCPIAVADAHPDILPHAKIVLNTKGGFGAIRELSDMILKRKEQE